MQWLFVIGFVVIAVAISLVAGIFLPFYVSGILLGAFLFYHILGQQYWARYEKCAEQYSVPGASSTDWRVMTVVFKYHPILRFLSYIFPDEFLQGVTVVPGMFMLVIGMILRATLIN